MKQYVHRLLSTLLATLAASLAACSRAPQPEPAPTPPTVVAPPAPPAKTVPVATPKDRSKITATLPVHDRAHTAKEIAIIAPLDLSLSRDSLPPPTGDDFVTHDVYSLDSVF